MPAVDHSENIIELENISFSYGEYEVLHDVSFSIHKGDYLAIVGRNGSGKTTLLKIILGLMKPTNGTVRLFGQDIRKFTEHARIGYVPQKATSFDPSFPATVEEVVLMGRHGRGLFRTTDERDMAAVTDALAAVDMEAYRDRQIGSLSGGQQQRVFIARALAGRPEVLFLDEPTVGVEQEIREEFYALIKKLNEELELTVVLVTHDLESVAHEAMHIACVDCTVFFHETPEEYGIQAHHH
ncbi:ABC transporter ATP-binding protein [Candidatus Kaiserbacteria bacterium]|nr:ABC transporter ATP-binding protein [Candidatus Kaiserbacteria bacterium]